MQVPTPFGPMATSPASTENGVVILWVVGALFAALGTAVILLWRKMQDNAIDCRKENERARAEAAAVRAQNEALYKAAIEATDRRETRLVEVVERNTAAFHALKEHVGSGYYRALQEQRESGANSPERRRPPTTH